MADSIRFEGVTKVFSLKNSSTLKDFVLGIAGHRTAVTKLTALDRVSFSVAEGESVALLGHNGSGKSTSLKMLAGVMSPTAGVVRARGRIAPLLELGSGFHPDLSGRENIYLNGAVLGIERAELQRRFEDIVDFAGVEQFLDTPVKFYSSGMAIRLGFAIAVNVEPDILIIDEVLSVGDSDFQKKSLERMMEFRRNGTTIMLVTHDRSAARNFCDRALLLDHGVLAHDGTFDDLPQP